MKIYRYFILAILVFDSVICFSQNPGLKFEHIGTAEGLSQINVNCIVQDRMGFIWVGTRDGLNKYDGYKFTIYRDDPNDSNTLSNNYVQDIVEDNEGNLWIATEGGGLNEYNVKHNSFKRYLHNNKNQNSLSSNNVNKLILDSVGNLWIGTERGIRLF